MALKLSIEIAKTHLLSKVKQTLVAMLGVTFGIGLYIGMVSMMTGVNDLTLELSMMATPDIHIYNDVGVVQNSILHKAYPDGLNILHHPKPKQEKINIKNAFHIISTLRNHDRVANVAPQLTSQVFYNYGPVQLNGTIYGTNIMEEDKLFDIRSKMKAGSFEDLVYSQDGILMGAGLAKKLNANVDDRIIITTPQGQTMRLKIVGIFQMGMGAIDDVKCYANIQTVQKILQEDSKYITDINIRLKDFTESQKLAAFFEAQFGYQAMDWETANATNQLGVSFRNILTYAVSTTLLLVAGFGIYNILNMTIYNKMKDIAILKAIGFAGGDVKTIFMIQAIIIGFMGGLAGLCLGYFISRGIAAAPFDGGEVLNIKHLPVNFNPAHYIIGMVFGMLTTTLAGYLPSRKASNIDPIEIIRGQ